MKIVQNISDISDWFFAFLLEQKKSSKMTMIWLSGGTSFDTWYSHLLEDSRWSEIEPRNIFWWLVDERMGCEENLRNDMHIWDIFLQTLVEKWYCFAENFLRPTQDSTGQEYTALLHSHFQAKENLFDIAFFWIGEDGHTASLFPATNYISSEEDGFIDIENAPKFPPNRISLSPMAISKIPHKCLFVVWNNKKEARESFFDDSVSIDQCPAKLVEPEIFLDLV